MKRKTKIGIWKERAGVKLNSWPEIGSDGDILLTAYVPKGITGYDDDSFLLEAESTPGPQCNRKDYCTDKIYPLLTCAISLLNFFLVVFSSV